MAALLGLVALPTLFGAGAAGIPSGDRVSVDAMLWLIVGLALSVWLLVLAPGLASVVVLAIARLELRGSVARVPRPSTGAVARLIVAIVDVALIQAILRQPLVSVLGVVADPTTVEATFAAGTLVVLIVTLVWLHQSARPLIEATAWQLLDAVIPTSGSERSRAFFDDADTMLATVQARTQEGDTASAPTRPALGDASTVPSPGSPSGSGEATLAAGETVAEGTIAGPGMPGSRDPQSPPMGAAADGP